MSEFKGTPGPWRIVRNQFEEYCSTEYCELAIKGHAEEMDLVVAGVVSDCIDEHKANANLIAAAPDLLSIAMRLTALEGEWHPDRYQDEKALLLKDARAVLAKALGQ